MHGSIRYLESLHDETVKRMNYSSSRSQGSYWKALIRDSSAVHGNIACLPKGKAKLGRKV